MMMDIMREIVDERSRQDAKWGPVHLLGHDDAKWLTILMEEVGEVARDMVEGRNPKRGDTTGRRGRRLMARG